MAKGKVSQAFEVLAVAVEDRLPPGRGRDGLPDTGGAVARRGHTAATLRQVAALVEAVEIDCGLAEIGLGCEILGSKLGTDPADQARAITLRQFSALCRELDGAIPPSLAEVALQKAFDVWAEIASALHRVAEVAKDARLAAMAKRWEAEAERLHAERP